MELKIPFEKSIKFDTDVFEICSISIEHEVTKNEQELLGNFIFEGTYKENELSINETPFNFIVPFSLDFTDPIDTNTIEFSIDNFTYDLINNELVLHVDYIVTGSIIKNEEKIDNIERNEEHEIIEVKNIDNRNEINIDNRNENNIFEDDYVTYHIHEVKDNESIEKIVNEYNIDIETLKKVNKSIEINKGSRLIIPINNE